MIYINEQISSSEAANGRYTLISSTPTELQSITRGFLYVPLWYCPDAADSSNPPRGACAEVASGGFGIDIIFYTGNVGGFTIYPGHTFFYV